MGCGDSQYEDTKSLHLAFESNQEACELLFKLLEERYFYYIKYMDLPIEEEIKTFDNNYIESAILKNVYYSNHCCNVPYFFVDRNMDNNEYQKWKIKISKEYCIRIWRAQDEIMNYFCVNYHNIDWKDEYKEKMSKVYKNYYDRCDPKIWRPVMIDILKARKEYMKKILGEDDPPSYEDVVPSIVK